MSKASIEKFIEASESVELARLIPEVKEISPEVAVELWDTYLSTGHWTKQKIFLAALGIALKLSRN